VRRRRKPPKQKNITTYNLARMNMLLHGVEDTEFDIFHGDTLLNEWDMMREQNPAKKPSFDAFKCPRSFKRVAAAAFAWETAWAIDLPGGWGGGAAHDPAGGCGKHLPPPGLESRQSSKGGANLGRKGRGLD
jgi:hypothetical protein